MVNTRTEFLFWNRVSIHIVVKAITMDCFGYQAKQVHEIMSQPWARKWCDASGTRVGLEVGIHSDSEEFLLSYV